jgi:predicted O-methyltransferase YrrM
LPTNEEIVDQLVTALGKAGLFDEVSPIPWTRFGFLARMIHRQFQVPGSTLTPIMRRLLFGIGYASRGRQVVGIGSYVGYALAFLASGASCHTPTERVTGLDPNRSANELARRNLAALPNLGEVVIVDGQSPGDLNAVPGAPDVVLLDLDSPRTGKLGYADALLGLVDRLPSGAVVAAHDACVSRFAEDFGAYHEVVDRHPRLRGPWILPVDRCGLSVSRVS